MGNRKIIVAGQITAIASSKVKEYDTVAKDVTEEDFDKIIKENTIEKIQEEEEEEEEEEAVDEVSDNKKEKTTVLEDDNERMNEGNETF